MTEEMPTYRTGLAVSAVVIAVLSLSLGDAIIKATSLDLPLWQMYILRSALVVPPLWWLVWRKGPDRKSTRLNSSHPSRSRMPSSA